MGKLGIIVVYIIITSYGGFSGFIKFIDTLCFHNLELQRVAHDIWTTHVSIHRYTRTMVLGFH
jgi:hypothetical protein